MVKALTVSVSLALGQYDPVPTAMPIVPWAKKPPTAGEESDLLVGVVVVQERPLGTDHPHVPPLRVALAHG